MTLININSLPNKNKKCSMKVTDEQFFIQGDFCYLINKEFRKTKTMSDSCLVKEYLGLASLHKRSPKKTMFFLVFAAVLEFADMLAGKIEDYFFFVNTDWTSYVVNTIAIICVALGIWAFFSKKKVVEISFLSKRFCVDEKLFSKDDINRLHQILMKLR